ncbi:hypothetical protein LBMAG53_31640 [Planctomycetota bacterium]|nr:hypothetical protein LBMAG53_31640 [Planctomycetota bacterium]
MADRRGRLPRRAAVGSTAWVWLCVALSLAGCARQPDPSGGWITLLDGSDLDGWSIVGDANWRAVDGSVQADHGVGFLVSRRSYGDVLVRVEVFVEPTVNSGIFIRCVDGSQLATLTPERCYEINLFDTRPDPTYGTGSIVLRSPVSPMPKAAGRWSTFEISAKGPRITVNLNGEQTAELTDGTFRQGPIALQYQGSGVARFRRVLIKPL